MRFFVYLLFFTCVIQAQTTAIPDANFEQELVNQGIDSNGLNGNILNADAQAITTLTLAGTAISDITGINAFVNLTDLDLGNNQVVNVAPTALAQLINFRSNDNEVLASVDFSQNSLLEKVFIHGNFPNTTLPSITTIDLSQNLNLVSFNGDFLDNVNNIIFPITSTLTDINVRYLSDPTFDLSLLSGLENLRIGGWRSNINITLPNVFTNLKNIRISSIDLPTIDISNYVNLESIYFWGTYVENLLLPNSTTLKDIYIILHDIQIPLDFSILPNLTDLDITLNRATPLVVDVTQNLLLEDIDLSRNDMNSIDLTQNVVLKQLRLDVNNLTSLDVTQNVLLNRLSARENRLPGIDLTQNVILSYLTLSNNLIPNLDVTQNINIRSISIDNNLFTGTGLDLTQNIDLSSLNVSHNQIESLDISQNINLYSFNLSHNIFPGNNILNQFYTIQNNRGRLAGSLIANNNLLTGTVPDFYGLYNPTIQTRRFQLYINENNFHFGDFESQHLGLVGLTTTMSIGPSPDFVIRNYLYAPQAKVNAIENLTVNAGDAITLTTTVRGAQNHYTWFKNGVAIPGAPDAPTYIINSANSCDAAVYHSEIRSDLVPFENANAPGTNGKNLLLIRNDITLNVTSPTESCTSLLSPVNGSTNVALNEVLTWAESLGACGYFLSVGTTSGGTDILNNIDVGDVESYNIGTNFPSNTQIFVTITPYFFNGTVLNCSEESFTTSGTVSPANCTSLIEPLNNASDVAVSTNISWNIANYATGYFISIGTTSGGNDIVNNQDMGNVTTYNPVNDFAEGIQVFVTITPYNSLGNTTGCSEESFTIIKNCIIPPKPTLECWQTATFNNTSCSWEVTGTQPPKPTLKCWETATFNNTSCTWEVIGTQPIKPTLECWETATFNNTSCTWKVTGTQPPKPTLKCWETATFNNTSCSWEVTGTQPAQPTIECWETATFNNTSCTWEVTGTQPAQPAIECWETATFNNTSCTWEVTGTEPPPVDVLPDVTGCDSYTLPMLTVGNYFTASNGGGTMLKAGTIITTSQIIYIYEVNGTCTDESSFKVNIEPLNVIKATINTVDFNAANNSISIDVINPIHNYEYSIDNGVSFGTSNKFKNLEAGIYTVVVRSDSPCEPDFIKTVSVLDYPRFFTPNGDGNNETWQIKGVSPQNFKEVRIFNRFGKVVGVLKSSDASWNGLYKNTKLLPSTYWFVATLIQNDKEIQIKGYFALKR